MGKSSNFESGGHLVVLECQVGPRGAVLRVEKSETPLDGISVEIPPGALAKDVLVTLSNEQGKLQVKSGTPSGVFLRLAAGSVSEFHEPVQVRFHYDPVVWKGYFAIGYAIDHEGSLDVIDKTGEDRTVGTVTFSTFVPSLLTWIFVKP